MISNDTFFFRRNQGVLFLQTADHPIYRILKIFHINFFLVFTGRYQSGFVTNVGNFGAGKARCLC
ncbi:hypothetical protein GALL_498120 [mine drainage metagenome]|uniref:Uncharacterized protein n=1 Tax=mine drainage metagenome TaxID=410659 RepID=A0A1J5PCW5_9ZZZZ